MRRSLLVFDALVNFALGTLLLFCPAQLAQWAGLPPVEPPFILHVFGGVLAGIGVALLLGSRGGLGGRGAAAINLSAAAVLVGWLLFGGLPLSTIGSVALWVLVVLLVALSALHLRQPV
jgi:uncharacterized membrane-anchored protein YitT (DUF2179 family)